MGFNVRSLRLVALLLMLNFTHTAIAQQAPQSRGQNSSDIASERRSGSNFHNSFASSEFALRTQVIVKGAPFSAVAVSETVQTLSDGSRVSRSRTARVSRDSEGRVRFEFGRDASKGKSFTLYDAVSGATYIGNSIRRAALQLSPPESDASLRRVKIITPQSLLENLRVVVGETIESLGVRIIEGVEAEGVRVTSRLPARADGSEQPGRVVYERWHSHALRSDVLIKCADPRFGEAVYRLAGINQAEPAPELFTIPSGYRVEPVAFGQRSRGHKMN